MMNGDFSDVTLVTEDKNIFKAHKNILSACSPFFKDLMTFDQNSSSIIYLRGVNFSELKLIMQFVYLGEATLHQESMSEFLNVAKSLEIKDLNPSPEDEITTGAGPAKNESEFNICGEDVTETNKECPDGLTLTENQDIPQDNLERGDNKIEAWHQGLESTFSCEQCDNKYSRSSHLRRHIKSKHDCLKYACDHCDFQTTIQYHLKKHIEELHEGIKYICNLCEYKATRKSNLKRHFEVRHEKEMNPFFTQA